MNLSATKPTKTAWIGAYTLMDYGAPKTIVPIEDACHFGLWDA